MSDQGPAPKPFYKRWWFITLVVLVIIGALARSGGSDRSSVDSGASTPAMDTSGTISTPSAVPAAETAETDPVAKVTLANFNRIKTGMTGEQVWEILGPGEMLSETEVGEYHTAMYSWKAENGIANMNVTFSNGKVSSKAQLGLE